MKRGDVILCRFPHASNTPPKIRPALVVQADFYNQRITNLLVAGVTTNMTNTADRAHLLIDVSTPEGKLSGLRSNSLVSCINLAVIPPRDVDRKIGELPAILIAKIDDCLKAA